MNTPPANRRPADRPPAPHGRGPAQWEAMTRQQARALPYPSTPDIAAAVMARLGRTPHDVQPRQMTRPRGHLVWVASLLLALLVTLWAVPPLRAALVEFLQIGAVRIWLVEPTPAPAALPTPTELPGNSELSNNRPRATVQPTPTPLRSLFDLAGETTLAAAEARAGFALRLPTYPAGLGLPDGVFYQDMNGPVVVLVWLDPAHAGKAAYSLHIFGPGTFATKGSPAVVATATVHGHEAAWLQGPYILAYGQGPAVDWQMRYLVSGRVLLWEEDGLTYRLESNLTLDEAIKMAESLRPTE